MAGFVQRHGKLLPAALAVMAAGVIVFAVSIPLYITTGIDLDVIGFLIFVAGLVLLMIWLIRKWKPRGFRLIVMSLVVILLMLWVVVPFIASLIYYWITGKPLGG